MAQGHRAALLWGAGWLHLSFLLDNCDGELARLKFGPTSFGKKFDLVSDFLVDCALWIGLALGASKLHGEGSWIFWSYIACFGSALNEGMVIWERQKGCCSSIHSVHTFLNEHRPSMLKKGFDFISHNGDVIIPVWILALIGRADFFLISGTIFINGLVLGRFLFHHRALLSK